MAKTPYFNKRRWLEGRQDEITELYRTGKSWREIIEHLKIAYAMPFALTEADFFKYCDFLLDEVATSHLEENIEESQEQDQFFEELQVTNSEQANKLIQQINLNKQLEQSSAALSRKNEQQGDKLEKISKYMDTIQAEMDKFSISEHDYTQQITKQKNTIFRLKAMLTVLFVILLGFAFKLGIFA